MLHREPSVRDLTWKVARSNNSGPNPPTTAPLTRVPPHPGHQASYHRDDRLSPDVGLFVVTLDYAACVEAELSDKPATRPFHTAAKRLQVDLSQVPMVGDDVESAVIGALDAGLQTSPVHTGKLTPADEERLADHAPVFDDFPTVVNWVMGNRDTAV